MTGGVVPSFSPTMNSTGRVTLATCERKSRLASAALEPVRMRLGKPERSRAAHRQTGEVCARDGQRVEQGDGVCNQQVERVAPGGRLRPAMAALVVAQDVERAPELVGLIVPHPQI